MNKIAVIAVTKNGLLLGNNIYEKTNKKVDRYTIEKIKEEGWNTLSSISLRDLVGRIFSYYEGIVLIMAVGIAVRILAPIIDNKASDPAVVVMDEKNKFAVSLLSGHLGGANELAGELGKMTGCQPVITTATDVNKLQAIDTIARSWSMKLEPLHNIKYFNTALLNSEKYNFWVEEGIILPRNIKQNKIENFNKNTPGFHVLVTSKIYNYSADNIIYLRPRNLFLGLGCRKNFPEENMTKKLYDFLQENKISVKSINSVGTIDLKAKEKAIINFITKEQLQLKVFSAKELSECFNTNTSLAKSDFVQKNVGTPGVSEPSALLAGGNKLIINKTKFDGFTLAISAKKPFEISDNNNSWFDGV